MKSFLLLLALAAVCLCQNKVDLNLDSHRFLVGLNSERLEEAEKLYWKIADPTSPDYLNYPSEDELVRLFSCSKAGLDASLRWLSAHGATDLTVSRHRDWIEGKGSSSLHDLLSSQFALPPYQRDETFPREMEVFLSSLTEQDGELAVTSGKNRVELYKERRKVFGTAATTDDENLGTPNAQRAAYGIPAELSGTNQNNKHMVWGSGTYGILESDMEKFFEMFNLDQNVTYLKGAGFPGDPTGDNFAEATLDVQYIASMANNILTIAWNNDNRSISEGSIGMGDAMLEFMYFLGDSKQDYLPKTMSLSLGSMSWYSCHFFCEKLTEQYPQYTYQECYKFSAAQFQVCVFTTKSIEDRINAELMKLGLREVTITAASGDGGAHFSFQKFPRTQEIGRDLNEICCNYTFATFPAESPYVVAVGGTEWLKTNSSDPYTWPPSGGAFSWGYDQQDFQKDVAANYIQQNSDNPIFPPSYMYPAGGRGVPDVSALAEDIPFYVDGQDALGGGTSFAAPEWAGVLSLVTDHRLNNGLKPLGPVASRLYYTAANQPGEAFHDITVGDNRFQANGDKCSSNTGYPAATGWDAATGLGRPIFGGLLQYLGDDSSLPRHKN